MCHLIENMDEGAADANRIELQDVISKHPQTLGVWFAL